MSFKLRKTKRAAVLGCGPAGLFATHALVENGWDVKIFSKRRRSEMFGAQYLHAPIPGLTQTEPVNINYVLHGTPEGYRYKVYGPNPVRTSVETLGKTHPGWDIREAYYRAWDQYESLITDQNVTPEFLGVSRPESEIGEEGGVFLALHYFNVIVNSIPLPDLCYQKKAHQFHSTSVWAIGDAPERGIYAPYKPSPNTVECNGLRDVGWYRSSNVFGYATVEWPGNRKPPLPQAAEVVKPLYTDCTCYRAREMGFRFKPVGRYGQWSKGVLSHSAYTQAAQL